MFLDCSPAIARQTRTGAAGVAVGDVDGDGEPEVFVCGAGGPNRVLKWTGAAVLDIASPELAGPPATAAAFADVDGDGREELYLVSAGVPDRLLDATPDGRWVDRLGAAAVSGGAGRAVAAIDRRGNGRYGFVVAGPGRPLRLFEVSQTGAVTDLAQPLEINLAARVHGLLVAPLVGDRPDVFALAGRGPNLLFRNTGVGTFLEVAAEHGLADPGESGGAAVVVAAGVCYANRDGPHRLMARRAGGVYRDAASPALALPSAAGAVVAADFDNDGFEELFFHNCGEANRLFRARAGGPADPIECAPDWSFADAGAAAEPDAPGAGAAVADLDGDGRLELLLTHAHPAPLPLTLYKGPRAGTAWLRVRPLTRFGAPARGAVVRLTAAGRTQTRVIDGGGGAGQVEPVAHFGLGRDPVVGDVAVTWPDGTCTVLDGPPPLQTVTVPYPGG